MMQFIFEWWIALVILMAAITIFVMLYLERGR